MSRLFFVMAGIAIGIVLYFARKHSKNNREKTGLESTEKPGCI